MAIYVQLTIAIRIKLADLINQITLNNFNQIMSLIIEPSFHCKDVYKSFIIHRTWEQNVKDNIMEIESEEKKLSAFKQFIEKSEYKNYYINLIPPHPKFNEKIDLCGGVDPDDLTDSTNEKYIIHHKRLEKGISSTYANLASIDDKKDRAVKLVDELGLQSDYSIVLHLETLD